MKKLLSVIIILLISAACFADTVSVLLIGDMGMRDAAEYVYHRKDGRFVPGIILADLRKTETETTFTFDAVTVDDRKLCTGDSHLTAITDPNHKDHALYVEKLSEPWDYIILRDFRESLTGDPNFPKNLAETVKAIKKLCPTAKVGRLMPEADLYTSITTAASLAGVCAKEAAVQLEIDKLEEGKPDFLVPVGIAVQNIRTGFPGKIPSLDEPDNPDYIDYITAVERNTKRLSGELGCYAAGLCLVGELCKLTGTNFDILRAELTYPEGAGEYAQTGEFTPEIMNIVKEGVDAALRRPAFLTVSGHKVDPIDKIAAKVTSSNVTKARDPERELRAAVSDDIRVVTIENNRVTFRVGYSQRTVTAK